MFKIMTVCTGNVCRSPLAQQLLDAGLADVPHQITSGGTFDMGSAPMPDDAQRLAMMLGVPATAAAEHRSQLISPQRLQAPDLILAMAREHRKAVVVQEPSRLRSVFTLRELARISASLSDADIVGAGRTATDPGERLRAAVGLAARERGMVGPPESPEDDDVIDPYRRDWEAYERSASQLVPAVEEVLRFVRLAVAADAR